MHAEHAFMSDLVHGRVQAAMMSKSMPGVCTQRGAAHKVQHILSHSKQPTLRVGTAITSLELQWDNAQISTGCM